MMYKLTRRKLLKQARQAGGVIAVGASLESLLVACGGNISTTSNAPGATSVASKGLLVPDKLQWGADFTSGAPYVFKDPANPNNLVGFEVEVANAIAKLMGITQHQVETDYNKLEAALQANQFDMIMNGWEITEDRKKTELFSVPYYHYGQQTVVRKDDERFAKFNDTSDVSLTDLEGYTVGTGAGYKAADILGTDTKIKTKLYDTDLPFDDLAQKKIDAVLIDQPAVAYYVLGAGPGGTKNPDLRPIGKPFKADDYVVGFNKQNPNAQTLLNEINQAFDILKKDGTLHRIYVKWSMWNDLQAQIGIV
ncbi:MAG: amino acid ABC transporter substrate-binding protein [Ktedonobacteraceae bacterium]|nr:amino acid ABC transporter substrate-binding protein [Ktedonobacteraceae bacterium]